MPIRTKPCPICGELMASSLLRCDRCEEQCNAQPDTVDDPHAIKRFSDNPTAATKGTLLARWIAAIIDNVLCIVIWRLTIELFPPVLLILLLHFLVVNLGYFFVSEILLSTTPGKLVTGLTIVGFDGSRCRWDQVFFRTFFRLFEANPIIGSLPAAIAVLTSSKRQRIGDRFAQTLVVPRWSLRM